MGAILDAVWHQRLAGAPTDDTPVPHLSSIRTPLMLAPAAPERVPIVREDVNAPGNRTDANREPSFQMLPVGNAHILARECGLRWPPRQLPLDPFSVRMRLPRYKAAAHAAQEKRTYE